MKEFEIQFIIDGQNMGSSFLTVEDGVVRDDAAVDEFYAIIRRNKAKLIADAEYEDKETLLKHNQAALQEAHAKDYHGTDDDMPDAFDDWFGDLSLEEVKQLLAKKLI